MSDKISAINQLPSLEVNKSCLENGCGVNIGGLEVIRRHDKPLGSRSIEICSSQAGVKLGFFFLSNFFPQIVTSAKKILTTSLEDAGEDTAGENFVLVLGIRHLIFFPITWFQSHAGSGQQTPNVQECNLIFMVQRS